MKQKGFSAILILVGIFLAVVIASGAYYFGKSQSGKSEIIPSPNPVVTPTAQPLSSRSPIQTNEAANTSDSTITKKESISTDKTRKLNLEIVDTKESSINTITVSDQTGTNRVTVYSQDLGKARGIIIPVNNWSPDSKYVFVIVSGPDSINPIIFKSDGSNFSNGNKYIEIGELFIKQISSLFIDGDIKWDSNNTLSFTTFDGNFKAGPNYIFDLSNLTFQKH